LHTVALEISLTIGFFRDKAIRKPTYFLSNWKWNTIKLNLKYEKPARIIRVLAGFVLYTNRSLISASLLGLCIQPNDLRVMSQKSESGHLIAILVDSTGYDNSATFQFKGLRSEVERIFGLGQNIVTRTIRIGSG